MTCNPPEQRGVTRGCGRIYSNESAKSSRGLPLALPPLERLELIQRSGPIRSEQAREAAIREQLAAGLAARAIVRLVVGVTDALNLFAAAGARLAISAVRGRAFAERSNFFREALESRGVEAVDPDLKSSARRLIKPIPLFGF